MLSLYHICPGQYQEHVVRNELSVGDWTNWEKKGPSSFKDTGEHCVLKSYLYNLSWHDSSDSNTGRRTYIKENYVNMFLLFSWFFKKRCKPSVRPVSVLEWMAHATYGAAWVARRVCSQELPVKTHYGFHTDQKLLQQTFELDVVPVSI